MTDYHDIRTFREKTAKLFYKLPVLPIPFERLVLRLISFIEPENPHWKHLGKNCPCMQQKSIKVAKN